MGYPLSNVRLELAELLLPKSSMCRPHGFSDFSKWPAYD